MKEWEIWFAKFPFEEDASIEKPRPVIILNIEPLEVLSIKVTSHNVRQKDQYDIPIIFWQQAGLDRESVARVAKTMILTPEKFIKCLGTLHNDDQTAIRDKYIEFISNE